MVAEFPRAVSWRLSGRPVPLWDVHNPDPVVLTWWVGVEWVNGPDSRRVVEAVRPGQALPTTPVPGRESC